MENGGIFFLINLLSRFFGQQYAGVTDMPGSHFPAAIWQLLMSHSQMAVPFACDVGSSWLVDPGRCFSDYFTSGWWMTVSFCIADPLVHSCGSILVQSPCLSWEDMYSFLNCAILDAYDELIPCHLQLIFVMSAWHVVYVAYKSIGERLHWLCT